MLFPEEDAPLLKAWIVKRIENTCVILLLEQYSIKDCANMYGIALMPMPMSSQNMSLLFSNTMATQTRCGSYANKRSRTF